MLVIGDLSQLTRAMGMWSCSMGKILVLTSKIRPTFTLFFIDIADKALKTVVKGFQIIGVWKSSTKAMQTNLYKKANETLL